MSRSVYMPTRSYSSNDLVKTAQARGLVDRFIEATYFGGRRLESKSTVFGTMMNELRNIDNKIRATLLNKTISKQTPYPNENMGSAEELLKNAQSAYDSKEYLLAISYLEQFYVKVLYCAQLLKNLDSIVAELNKEYYKSLLEPLKEDQIERIKKFLKDRKEAEYLPADTRQDIEEGKANIEGKLKATTSARYGLNKKAGFYKQAGLISWVQGLFNPREAALTLWERIQPGASKDLKRDIGRVLSASNRLFNVFKNSLETMSSARANREIAKYQTAAKTIPAQVNSYSELINDANFNKYTQQLNDVLASIATPQQAAKVQQNPSPDASVLAAQVASGNTGSPVGAPVVYSLGSGKDINDFKPSQQVYVVKDNARISATVNNVDKNNKVSVNIDGFPDPILLNPNQIFINDAAIVIQNAVNSGAVSAPVDASDPAAAVAVIQQAGNAVAGNINNAAVEPPQAPPDPVNPVNPAGTPPPDAGGAGDAPAGGTPADFSGAGGSGGDLTPLQKSIALKIYEYMFKEPNEDKLAMYIAALFGSGWSHKKNIGPKKLIDEVAKKIEEYENYNLLGKYVDESSGEKVFYIKKPSLKNKTDKLMTDDVYGIKEYFDLAQKDLPPLESSNIPGNLLFTTSWEEGAGDNIAGGTPAGGAGDTGAPADGTTPEKKNYVLTTKFRNGIQDSIKKIDFNSKIRELPKYIEVNFLKDEIVPGGKNIRKVVEYEDYTSIIDEGSLLDSIPADSPSDGGDGSASGAGAGADEKTVKLKLNSFTKNKFIDININNLGGPEIKYDSVSDFNNSHIEKYLDEAINSLNNINNGKYIEINIGESEIFNDNFKTIGKRKLSQPPWFNVKFIKYKDEGSKFGPKIDYIINFALDPSDEYVEPDAASPPSPGKTDEPEASPLLYEVPQFKPPTEELPGESIHGAVPEEEERGEEEEREKKEVARLRQLLNRMYPKERLTYEIINIINNNPTGEKVSLNINTNDFLNYLNIQGPEKDNLTNTIKKNFPSQVPVVINHVKLEENIYTIYFFCKTDLFKNLAYEYANFFPSGLGPSLTLNAQDFIAYVKENLPVVYQQAEILAKNASFTYALQALSNESPIIVASFIRRYANLIQNKNKKLSNNLHKIASRIK